MMFEMLSLIVSAILKGTLGPAPPAGPGMEKTGGALMHWFCRLEKSNSTLYVADPAPTVVSRGSHRSAISPWFELSNQPSGGPRTLADAPSGSVTVSAISWLETIVAFCNVVPDPQAPCTEQPPAEKSGKTP